MGPEKPGRRKWPSIDDMHAAITAHLQVCNDGMNINAPPTQKLGPGGRNEGIAARALAQPVPSARS